MFQIQISYCLIAAPAVAADDSFPNASSKVKILQAKDRTVGHYGNEIAATHHYIDGNF